jgi:hypothetical protein
VRIAVLVNARGEWGAAGCHGADDVSQVELINTWFDDGEFTPVAVHFIEADLTLPVSLVVEGQVVP